MDNPWIGSVWASQDLVTLEHSNRAFDAVSVVKSAENWRQIEELKAAERAR